MQDPTLEMIRSTYSRLEALTVRTPVHHWQAPELTDLLDDQTELFLKLELFQATGTFKARGALNVMLHLDREELARGVTAVSAGNHAIAVAYAARLLGTTAKVVMPRSALAFRIRKCQRFGAEVVLAENVTEAFAMVQRIEQEEDRHFVHPFEGPHTIMGAAGVGLEFAEQAPQLDACIIPIGGGGLCAGMAAALKLLNPKIAIYGVEPEGADTMHRSFAAGAPQSLDRVTTIADSLGAPHAAPYSFELCQRYVDDLVKIDDDAMRSAMRLLFHSMKLAVEPAGAAATAALCGPLRTRLTGKQVGVVVCGANIDVETYAEIVAM